MLKYMLTPRCCDSRMGGGVLAALGSHVIDIISYLALGRWPIVSVHRDVDPLLVRITRVHATLRTLTPTTDNIRGIRQVTAEDVAVLQLQLQVCLPPPLLLTTTCRAVPSPW